MTGAPVDFARIVAWRDSVAAEEIAAGAAAFMGKPDAWFDDLHWFCGNGHVSGMYLKSERRGECCLACGERVALGPKIGEAAFAPILAALAVPPP